MSAVDGVKDTPVTEEPGKGPIEEEKINREDNDGETTPELFPSASSWLNTGSSWFTTAREKTMSTFDMMKKDLGELREVMSTEVSDLTAAAKGGIDSTVTVVKQQAQYLEKLVSPDEEEKDLPAEAKEATEALTESPEKPIVEEEDLLNMVGKSASMGFGWMKSLVDTVADSVKDTVKNLAMEETYKDEDQFTEAIRSRTRLMRNTKLSQEKLAALQKNVDTFLKEPSDAETFNAWVSRFHIEEHDAEINMLLGSAPELRDNYKQLVPSDIDAKTFWIRYFYTVDMAEIDEEMNSSFTLKELTTKGRNHAKDGSDDAINVEPTSPAKSTDDWSVCSEKNEVEEISSNASEDGSGPGTPKPEKTATEKNPKGEDWVDWDE